MPPLCQQLPISAQPFERRPFCKWQWRPRCRPGALPTAVMDEPWLGPAAATICCAGPPPRTPPIDALVPLLRIKGERKKSGSDKRHLEKRELAHGREEMNEKA